MEQYEKLAELMLEKDKEGKPFTFYHYMIDLTGGPCIYKRISGCGSGTEYMAVTPWGDLYPCHQFVGDEKFKLGDIFNGVDNTEIQDEIIEESSTSEEEALNDIEIIDETIVLQNDQIDELICETIVNQIIEEPTSVSEEEYINLLSNMLHSYFDAYKENAIRFLKDNAYCMCLTQKAKMYLGLL